jgi:hypothetical protein
MDEVRLGANSVVLRHQGGMDVGMRGLESRRLYWSTARCVAFCEGRHIRTIIFDLELIF